jgi:hypothetical protein
LRRAPHFFAAFFFSAFFFGAFFATFFFAFFLATSRPPYNVLGVAVSSATLGTTHDRHFAAETRQRTPRHPVTGAPRAATSRRSFPQQVKFLPSQETSTQ